MTLIPCHLCLRGDSRSRLRPRMMLRIDALKPVKRYMRINLCGRNVGVAEDRLHGAQIGAVLHHVRRAGVAQHVRTGVPARSEPRLAHQLPDALPAQPPRAAPRNSSARISSVRQHFPGVSSNIAAMPAGPGLPAAPCVLCPLCRAPGCIRDRASNLPNARPRPPKRAAPRHREVRAWRDPAGPSPAPARFLCAMDNGRTASQCRPARPVSIDSTSPRLSDFGSTFHCFGESILSVGSLSTFPSSNK